jgi:hypothetical protein
MLIKTYLLYLKNINPNKTVPMKNLLLFALAILLCFTGCKKDKDEISQVAFTYEAMSPLITKTMNYIKQASPGVIDEEATETDFLSFTYDKITSLGDIWINYNFASSKCEDILILTESEELSAVGYLMNMAEDEVGTALSYDLSYYDASSDLQDEVFDTYDELWGFIDDNSITVDDIVDISCGYRNGDYMIIVGGFWLGDYFWPVAGISLYEPAKSTSTEPNTKALMERVKHLGLKK